MGTSKNQIVANKPNEIIRLYACVDSRAKMRI